MALSTIDTDQEADLIRDLMLKSTGKHRVKATLAIFARLVIQGKTGKMEINLTQGGIGSISFKEDFF